MWTEPGIRLHKSAHDPGSDFASRAYLGDEYFKYSEQYAFD